MALPLFHDPIAQDLSAINRSKATQEAQRMGGILDPRCLLTHGQSAHRHRPTRETRAILRIDLDFGQHERGSLCHHPGQESLQGNGERPQRVFLYGPVARGFFGI